jgi:nifR3 family TIM-barrel protein
MHAHGLAPIFIYAPTTSQARMRQIAEHAQGFVYCVARKGVTGLQTDFSQELGHYLERCRSATSLPLALGFGVKDKADIDFLTGKADIAVIGTQTIRIVEECGAEVVDLNMGCPMPKITGKGKGAALMRDVTGTALILRALKKALSVPFTVKIRGGWDDEHLNAVEVAQMAEAEGVDAITVHPRTRSQRFTGRAPWTIIKDVVEAVRIPITGNGDVKSMAEARRMVAATGCVSVMIGRGALGSPWIFEEGFDALSPEDQRACKARIIARHCELIRSHYREKYALIQMKKHLAWYTEGLGHAARCRAEIFQTRTPDEVWQVFQRYWEAPDS